MPVFRADERFVGALAEAVATRVVEQLDKGPVAEERFLDTDGAARHLATSRERIHRLTSAGVLRPDGHDGRRPLYRPSSLDRYVSQGEESRS